MTKPLCGPIENWREYVTDDVQLVIDLDSPCFMAASAHETSELKVVHKASGRELFFETNKPIIESYITNENEKDNPDYKPKWAQRDTGRRENVRFKNRTEFWGSGKKKIGGWLEGVNIKKELAGQEPATKEDFEISEVYTAGEASHAIYALKLKVQQIKDYLEIQDAIYLIGSGDNHRTNLPLPQHYKDGRHHRPLLLSDVRNYAREQMGAEDIKGVEADDVINFYAWESHKHYKRTGKHKYIIVSIDKDQMGFDGMLFNPYKDEETKKFKRPFPYLIDGLGDIELVNGKVKGYGKKWLLTQMTIGDSVDTFGPTRGFNHKFGDVAAYKLLKPCKTLQEAVEAVCTQYQTWFPDGVQYTSWDGKEMNLTWYEWADMIWACAYMLKSREDKTTFTSVLDKIGVDYV